MNCKNNIRTTQGDTLYQEFVFTDENNVALDLDQWDDIRMQVRKKPDQTAIIECSKKDLSITATGLNKCLVTKKIPVDVDGLFLYDLELVDIDFNVITVIDGYFIIKKQITQ